MRTKLLILAAVIGVVAVAVPVWAHHAFAAEFDGTKQIKLQGKVTKMEWINPHAWLHIDVKGTDGKIVSWDIELGPPNALVKRGWNKTSIPAGLEVVVEGYLSKDGANRANGRDVMFPDGRKLFASSSNPEAPDAGQPK
jgi:hypothetical protein